MPLQQDYLRQAHNLYINLCQSLCLRRRFHRHTEQLKLYYITGILYCILSLSLLLATAAAAAAAAATTTTIH